jgi:hypothetical protein
MVKVYTGFVDSRKQRLAKSERLLIPENKGWPKFESRKLRFFKAFLIYLPNVLPALAEPTWKLFY